MFMTFFIIILTAAVATKLWLAARQIRYVSAHRGMVPAQFQQTISLVAHQRAANYTVACTRLAIAETLAGAIMLILLTFMGGLQWLTVTLTHWFGRGYAQQIALIVTVIMLFGLIDLLFDSIRQFIIEQRFGFNRMTKMLFIHDLIKSLALSALLGTPLLFAVLWLMEQAGPFWWLWAWGIWAAFSMLMLVLYPKLLAPLFNKFEPLRDETMRARIEALAKRCGFAVKSLFVIDGSRRSTHGNAYFTGLGASKRIVIFDTLLARLNHDEIEAVLAHELGHFKRRHLGKRLAATLVISLVLFALLGWLAQRGEFYSSVGLPPRLGLDNHALVLILFSLVAPLCFFFVSPFASLLSRKHEFEADAFAAAQTNAGALASALVKLYRDNAATLTPDPLYSAFYHSHPPASQRIKRLLASAA